MDLEADHGLPIPQNVGELLHASSPPFPAKSGATDAWAAAPRSTAAANVSRSRSLKAGPTSWAETGRPEVAPRPSGTEMPPLPAMLMLMV